MRFETEPGYQAQFDMKEKMKLIDQHGSEIKVYIPTLTLSWSRYNHRILTIDTKIETLLSFLAASFEEIGGVPKELFIDHLKQFVEKPRNQGHHAILTTKFDEFCRDYNIQVKPCMPYRPQTKGKTETQNKIVERLKNYNGKYEDIVAMHERLEKINQEDNESISQATKFPRVFLLEKEKGDLNPLPPKEIRSKYHLSLSEVYVSKESMISYQSNKYSVPKKFIGLKVGRLIVRDELHIYDNNKIITTHKITNHLLNIKKEHELIYPKLTTKTIENDQISASELKGLYKVLNKEVIAKDENNKLYNVKVAGFPFLKKLDDYDFSFQPTVSEDKIRAIGASNFYDEGTNIVFIGNPGVGKTHLAISIGYEVAIKRNSVYFITFNKLIMILKNAYHEGTFDKRVKHFFKYKLLIIDEVGFNEITPLEAKLFFQLIDLRYTKKSTIFTSNMTFDKWPQILGNDEMITKAI